MNLEYVKLRLEALRDAATRTRLAYIILTTASLAIMVAVWNSYLTWEDFAVYQDVWPARGGKSFTVLAAAHADLIEQWIKTRWLTVAPLGIQIGSDDLAVWGSLGLGMIAIWFLFSVRLENQIVAWLLTSTMSADKSLQNEVFVGVLSRLLFVRVSASDGPYDALPATIRVSEHSPSSSRFFVFLRGSSRWLLFLPSAAIFMIIALDVASWFFIGSAFNIDHVPIWRHLSNLRRLRAIGMDAFCGVVGVFVTFMLVKVTEFEAATRRLLRDYWKFALNPDDLPQL